MALCKNVGSVDRDFRAIVGIVAFVLAFTALSVMTGATVHPKEFVHVRSS
jgi:hypothetical protein